MRKLIRASVKWDNDAYVIKALFEPAEEHEHRFKDKSSLLGFMNAILPDGFDAKDFRESS